MKGKKLYNILCKDECQLSKDQIIGETLENKMMERFEIENGNPRHNAESSTTGDDQEEKEEYRTEDHQRDGN